jgi:hypothetical protein
MSPLGLNQNEWTENDGKGAQVVFIVISIIMLIVCSVIVFFIVK